MRTKKPHPPFVLNKYTEKQKGEYALNAKNELAKRLAAMISGEIPASTEVINDILKDYTIQREAKDRLIYFSVRARLMLQEYMKGRKGGKGLFVSSKSP